MNRKSSRDQKRALRRQITDRQHLTPETYGMVKDKARAEALQEHAQASDVVRALHSASGMAPEAIDELRDLPAAPKGDTGP